MKGHPAGWFGGRHRKVPACHFVQVRVNFKPTIYAHV